MNLKINNQDIPSSFDRIAKELIQDYALFVNDVEFRFTEIEFYYFHYDIHEDKYTHKHDRDGGEWRFHNQGFDLTFQWDNQTDGGVLIRGLKKVGGEYVNGPRKVIMKIFEAFGKAIKESTIVLKPASKRTADIYKCFRHLPNKVQYKEFHDKPYRYYTDLDDLVIPKAQKDMMKDKMKKVE